MLCSVALRSGLKVLGDDFIGRVLAAATAATDRKLALHLEQRARATINGIADLAVTHCVADAYVHVGPSNRQSPPRAALNETMVIANKNDCQLHRLRIIANAGS